VKYGNHLSEYVAQWGNVSAAKPTLVLKPPPRMVTFAQTRDQDDTLGQLHLSGDMVLLAQPKFFAAWLRPLFRKNWVVYSKPPFGGPEYVLQYLGRYTHRVAISNHRLVSLAGGQVTFRWRDSAHHNDRN
jgi:hypothetical protein